MPDNQPLKTRGFVLWLDASDGSVPTHDGIQWPDGWASIRHRHYGHTTTHHTPEAAAHSAHGKQGRIVWNPPPLTPCTCRQAVHAREHTGRPVDGCTWCMPTPNIRPNQNHQPTVQTVDAHLLNTTQEA